MVLSPIGVCLLFVCQEFDLAQSPGHFCSDARRAHLHCRDPAFMTMIPNAARKASPEKIISYRKHYRCGQTLIAQDISSGCVPVIMGSSTDSPCMSALCAHQGVTQCRVYFKTGRPRHSPHCPCFTDLSLLRLGCACALRTGISQDAPYRCRQKVSARWQSIRLEAGEGSHRRQRCQPPSRAR